MSTVQWRPELNALTTPRSYRARPVPKDLIGYDELAAAISQKNPLWNASLVKAIVLAERDEIMAQLINGNKVSLENAFTWQLSLAVRLDAPDDPLPPAEDIVKVQVYAARAFVDEVRQKVQLERLPPSEKAPVIAGTEDTVLRLPDVLNPAGVLRLTGTELFFNPDASGEECVIEGTRNGRIVQRRFAKTANTEILVVPDIPAQTDPWNNEYRVAITTRYTENGSFRTGTYVRPLRSPLAVTLGNGSGILSGSGSAPLVIVTEGTLTAETARVRLQAVLNAQDGDLRLRLLDMSDNGAAGQEIQVSADGSYTLTGFAGSVLTSLNITVNNYSVLLTLVRTDYTGRLVDILDVTQGT
jgi:hypothetical protein